MDKDYQDFVERMGSFEMEIDIPDDDLTHNELIHYGVLGMKWGIRKGTSQRSLARQDKRWVRKNSSKITKAARRQTARELTVYGNELKKDKKAYNKTGKLSAATTNAYNRKMSALMTESVSGLTSPSGKVVSFVAKRGELGVFMALSDQSYNMAALKNGIYDSGKVAYKKTVVKRMDH